MSRYLEEGTFVIRLDLAADFPEEYEGDDDGYAWLEAFRGGLRPAIVSAVMDVLRKDGRFVAVPVSRGKDPETEVEVKVSFQPKAAKLRR